MKFLQALRKILGALTDVLIKGRQAGLYDEATNPRPWEQKGGPGGPPR